jgi:hypothetical protein
MPRYNRNAATAYREAQLDSNTDYIGTGCSGQEWKMDDVCPLLVANARHSSPQGHIAPLSTRRTTSAARQSADNNLSSP